MHILLVQPSKELLEVFETVCARSAHELGSEDTEAAAMRHVREKKPDVVVLPTELGRDALRALSIEHRAVDDTRETIAVGPPASLRDLPDHVTDVLTTPLEADAIEVRLALVQRRFLAETHTPRETVLATALEAAGDIIEITDANATIQYVNPAFVRTMGYSREEAVGKTPKMLIRSNMHRPEFFTEMERCLSEGRQWSGLVISQSKDGRLVYLEGTLSPVANRDGVITHHIGVKRDVTERIRAEQEMRRTNEELENARDAALEASRAKSRFLANMSHELRTPLNAIIGYSEMLAEESEDLEDGTFVEDLAKITTAARHLLSLINDVLDFSKIEAGGMDLFVEPFPVEAVLRTVRQTMARLIDDRGNRLFIEEQDELGSMTQDITKLRQTLLNLIGNANKFTERGEIRLRVRRYEIGESEWLSFAVEDTGIGMSDQQVKRLFQPFTQADASTTRKYGGTGLGLTICKAFCQMMDGHIEVESKLGKGSTFTVHLPAELTAPPSSRRAAGAGGPTQALGRVLVIDDDPLVRDLLTRSLGKRGFSVDTAPDGGAGIELARATHPDVIVLDVLMPGMDGWQVIAELKRDDATCDIPVVMLTILEQANVGFALGASDFILKPIVPDQVAAAIGRHCAKDKGTILVVEDDPSTRELVRRTLEKRGYEVIEADNGRTALERLDASLPNAIVLDLLMPELDGFSFLEELRTRGHVEVPVIVATAKDLTPEERRTLEARVEQILHKGDYDRDALLSALGRSVATAASPNMRTSGPSA